MADYEQLPYGSFRGARFIVEADDMDFGRRNEVHEFPLRSSYPEELGPATGKYDFRCYVIGPDYKAAAAKLIEAINHAGPGTLVHPDPNIGTVRVSVLRARKIHRSNERGIERFNFTFVNAGKNNLPDQVIDTSYEVEKKADTALAALANDFTSRFTTESMPEFIRNGALDDLNHAIDSINGAISSTPGLESLGIDLSTLSGDLPSLISTPSSIASRFTSLLGSLKSKTTSFLNSLSSLRGMFSFGDELPAVATTTPSRTIQAANQGAVTALIRRSALIEATRTTATLEYENYTQAITIRDELAELLDVEMETADDSVYQALADLRIALVRDIAGRGTQLPRLSHHTPATTLPALVVAHQVYGDANRDGELITRNNIRHPGFVSGGDALEVLSDV
ncbi:MAG: DNA circularization N-terminal domain-containing protein [Candidatus Sedimenticola sp. (ex Thyasira tokunagai)]